MTVVAAYKCPQTKEYWIASDSFGFTDAFKENHGSKLRKLNNYVLSFAGTYRVPDLIVEDDIVPKNINTIKDLRDFRDLTQLILEENKFEYVKEEVIPAHPLDFIFITKLGIYLLDGNYQLLKAEDGYSATGAGRDIAMGSLFTSKKNKLTGRKAVTLAVQAAKRHCPGCEGKIYFAAIDKNGKIIK